MFTTTSFTNLIRIKTAILIVAVWTTWSGSSVAQTSKNVRLGPLIGDDVVTELSGIAKGGKLLTGDQDAIQLADFRVIEFSDHVPTQPKNPILVSTNDGGMLYASAVSIGEDHCRISLAAGSVSLPIEQIKSIELQPDPTSEAYRRALKSQDPDFDKVLVKSDGQYQAASVIIDSLSDEAVNFEYGDQQVSLPREKVYAILIASVAQQTNSRQPAKVMLTDGSSLMGQVQKLDGGKLHLQLAQADIVQLDWNRLARIEMNSAKIQYLSDLNPIFEKQTPIVTLPRKWRRDASIEGHPLQLRSEDGDAPRVFAKGIGTNSMSELVFQNDGEFSHIAAIIGIDVETNGRGDCQFVVAGDGKELFSRRVKGTDSPYQMLVDIGQAKEVSIVVNPGEELDLADHANWCDVRFLKLDP